MASSVSNPFPGGPNPGIIYVFIYRRHPTARFRNQQPGRISANPDTGKAIARAGLLFDQLPDYPSHGIATSHQVMG